MQSCAKSVTLNKLAENYLFLYAKIKKLLFRSFFDELDKKLGNLISNNLPLNRDNFDKTFNQFVNLIAKIINKRAPLERPSPK